MAKKITPQNDLEKHLLKAQNEEIDFLTFAKFFWQSELILPSSEKVINANFSPLVFQKESEKMISVFTSNPLLRIYRKSIVECIILKGKDLFEQIPTNHGLVINPGYQVGFDISSRGIKELVLALCGQNQ